MGTNENTTPIRVAFLMHKMQVAGAEVLVTQIIDQLGKRIQPVVLCLDAIGELGYKLIDQGVPVVSLDREPGMDWSVAKRLATELRDRRISVVHAHQYTPFFYTALARLRHGARAKVVFTEHGRHYPDIVSWKRRWVNRLLLQRYAEITTACCDFSTAALRSIEGFPGAFTLPNGVQLDTLPARDSASKEFRNELGIDQDVPLAACVARFHPVKDHATLIRGWALVHRRLPQARLLLVGDGEERANIQKQIEELAHSQAELGNFAQSILFLRDDVPRILREIDAFTLTSVSEAASLTLLEAMASECPSVVTDVGGNGEHLREGTDGYLVPRGDSEALADRLTELLIDRSLGEKMGQSARSRVAQSFNLPSVIEEYYGLYQKLEMSPASEIPSMNGPVSAAHPSSLAREEP